MRSVHLFNRMPDEQYVMVRWCPQCQQKYQTADGACPDCGAEGGPS